MPNIELTNDDGGSTIKLTDLGADKARLIETLGGCASGACACSTGEFDKVDTMSVDDQGDRIVIDVRTKDGQHINPSAVEECLADPAAEDNASAACC